MVEVTFRKKRRNYDEGGKKFYDLLFLVRLVKAITRLLSFFVMNSSFRKNKKKRQQATEILENGNTSTLASRRQ